MAVYSRLLPRHCYYNYHYHYYPVLLPLFTRILYKMPRVQHHQDMHSRGHRRRRHRRGRRRGLEYRRRGRRRCR